MILLTLKNGIPVSWRTYSNQLALAKEIKKRRGVVLTYGHIELLRREGKYEISQDLWLLWDWLDEMGKKQSEDNEDSEERYIHPEY